ncbi:hypothetical protein TPHA_0D03280 [Tetrapisispora phaffii CBS 4417]|uniref:MARVEL domain-containing protein n=1 Tax=Tetrapisispora phaffii (strain ATCC 24235 / CBS 4417 / NBRC 1672 / NRRL Y-8282 / UCD 70-5) TaxID=1071381 RepID=G8BSZ3_TETPH|nr:hypothetical protein TPHA_0D03280 [Tetrapisispora phaffii CBS 4417]CCE62964.1 hypothetical protein TPHA_0D03280 [Tetrapisispora phaffii CBS 4417]
MLGLADNILRGVNFCFFVICLGLVGSLLATQNQHSSRVNYCIFVPPFALVTDTFYGALANIWSTPLAWPIILFCFDFLNFAFTFTAGTVLAVGTRTHSCTNQSYLDSNNITQGSTDRCRKAQAATAFFYFSFFIFLAKLIMSSINLFTNGALGSMSFGRRRGGAGVGVPGAASPQIGVPNISQV